MIERIHQATSAHGDVAVVVPAFRVADLRRDIDALKSSDALNDFQRHIVDNIYALDIPDVGFTVRSVILVATPSAAARITFTWQGRSIPVMIPPGYVGNTTSPIRIEGYLNEALAPEGHQARCAPRLPKKLLAVRSGLGVFGRNNLCYVEGMGSLLNLVSLYSDVPCAEGSWHEIRQMDTCLGCEACLNSCPTGAITRERFLIDNERCLTFFNEVGPEFEFPEWIPPSVHHVAYGCSRCLAVCPENGARIGIVGEQVTFTEEETGLLLRGLSFERLPEELQRKVSALDMSDYLGALPRNLRALGMTSLSS